jgi:hypothetical protein
MMNLKADYLFYNEHENFERLVFDIHLINHQWHGLESIESARALCDELKFIKDMRQLRLIRFHRALIHLEESEDKPGTFLIRLLRVVGGYDHAAHIPIHKVPIELVHQIQ